MGEGEAGWFRRGQSLKESVCPLDWWRETVRKFSCKREAEALAVGGTWLSSLDICGNGHLEVDSGFQHARRMAHSLLLVLPCIERINLSCPFLPPSSRLSFNLGQNFLLVSSYMANLLGTSGLTPRIHHPVLLHFITGENDKLSPSSSPPAPTPATPSPFAALSLEIRDIDWSSAQCKTAPEHLCDRNARHDDRWGPGAISLADPSCPMCRCSVE